MKVGLEAIGNYEGVAVRILSYFLTEDAKYVLHAQMSPDTRIQGMETTLTNVFNALIRRLITDDVQ